MVEAAGILLQSAIPLPKRSRCANLLRTSSMNGSTPTRPSLLLQIRDASDNKAWEDFVRIYTPLIYGFCRQRHLQEADAADVAQEVLKAVARAVQTFDYDSARGKFRSWLLTVTRSKLNNFLLSRQRHPAANTAALEHLDELPSAEESTNWDRDFQKRLFEWASARVKGEVKGKTWDAFWQASIEGRPAEEVAANLDLSLGAVYVAKSRVLARLRELISSVAEEPPNLEGIVR